ncbi:hypothetical protein CSC2_09220 [Clostridium zeae]|uniref:Transposase n=1 Tax=Clostridium zeae TaxID=2759022 RepID=A0ABQ1E6S3_9CLOT|nr:hypothetical protein CSC2_09220 [Clostridium zeae]
MNTELLREFKEDKKGILDVRVKTKNNEHIDAEIMDQMTREKTAREQGFEQGTNQKAIEIAKNLLGLIDDETIALKTGLPLETVKNLRN